MNRKIGREIEETVSILIPCYNGEKTLARCLKSLLQQTYRKLEVILVNDGSTDRSEEVALQYKELFEKESMVFRYVKQKNQGLGGAINTALKYFTGEFLCWGDCDDFFMPESVEKRYKFLKEHPEYGSVSSDGYIYMPSDLENPVGLVSKSAKDLDNPWQFMNHLNGQPLFCAGCHMLRTEAFLSVNPTRDIYPARYGQNHQMLMPVYYKYMHAFLPIPLYGYVFYSDSMSRKKLPIKERAKRNKEYCNILRYTIKQIQIPFWEKQTYFNIVRGHYYRGKLYIGLESHRYFIVGANLIKLFLIGELTERDRKVLQQLILKRIRR